MSVKKKLIIFEYMKKKKHDDNSLFLRIPHFPENPRYTKIEKVDGNITFFGRYTTIAKPTNPMQRQRWKPWEIALF